MISRRRFLEVGSVAVGGAVGGTMGATMAARPILATARAANLDDASLPPSLAKLKSRKSEATPITRQERHERQERARKLMSENALDAILLMEGTSLQYFTGIHWWGGERMFALVLPAKGAAVYVCPAFEEGRAREQIANAPDGEQAGGQDGGQDDVRVWQEDENPYQRVAQGLRERGIAGGKLGIEETIHFVFTDGIAKAAPQVQITSATPVTAGCRMIKSAHEIALMRLAAQVTLAAYEAAYLAVKDGMTKPQLEELVQKAHERLGFTGGADVQVGEFSAFPHGSVTPQVLHEGTIVLVDGGCAVEGYQSDITRTFVLGRAPGKTGDKMKNVFEIVRNAQSAAL